MKDETGESIAYAVLIALVILCCGFYVAFVVDQRRQIKEQEERITYLTFESSASHEIASSMISLLDLCLIERNDGLSEK